MPLEPVNAVALDLPQIPSGIFFLKDETLIRICFFSFTS